MELTWLGVAGFLIKSQEGEIATDPFLTRGLGAPSPFTTKSFENCRAVLVGHGHFDHTFDIPEIVAHTDLKVYAPGLTGQILRLRGVPEKRLIHAHNQDVLFRPFKVRAFKSSHIRFDMPLILSTVHRCGIKGCMHLAPLVFGYPKGLVQTYYLEAEGKKILFVSSAGSCQKELETYKKLEVDYYLAPIQGHSSIQEIVAKQIAYVNPKVVIPHHHDDFYPPLSQSISIQVFEEKLRSFGYTGKLLELPLFHSAHL